MTHRRRALASVLVTALVGVVVLVATPAYAFVDKDCSDFATQADAQAFYLANGGPAADPHRLDAEGDGLACETLPCPCSTSPAPLAPQPAPAPLVSRCVQNAKVTQRAVVERVIDGDTLRARVDGARTKVRLLGIDTPERGRKDYGAATKALKKLTPVGRTVTLTSDPTQPYDDQYGRMLRYVRRGSTDVNRAQLLKGWARFYDARTCAPLTKKGLYKRAERSAKKADRGIWR
ncbi:thermonuclease family protein [Aeromicrobium fastidiosum]|uniref:thermonuclease family protein n=1 Tax=Aeromicrobium fastidiosum TaxID=52699 RepID=UPI00100E840C|nr:thermonuclease family protein [Aeromicrobium fastidiosum]MBP2388975.1 endonuclease YncB(thermonuclease family) [Aeromicrobium fastidiosum]